MQALWPRCAELRWNKNRKTLGSLRRFSLLLMSVDLTSSNGRISKSHRNKQGMFAWESHDWNNYDLTICVTNMNVYITASAESPWPHYLKWYLCVNLSSTLSPPEGFSQLWVSYNVSFRRYTISIPSQMRASSPEAINEIKTQILMGLQVFPPL